MKPETRMLFNTRKLSKYCPNSDLVMVIIGFLIQGRGKDSKEKGMLGTKDRVGVGDR